MTDMPTSYETHQTTTTTHNSGGAIAPRMEYLRSVPGVLKIVEIILDLIVIICSCVWWLTATGWVRFVAFSAFFTTIVYFFLYFLSVVPQIQARFGLWSLVEFIYYVVVSIFYLIAFIICAIYAYAGPPITASAVFTFLATGVYVLDTFWIQLKAWRGGSTTTSGHSAATTTTTTTTSTSKVLDLLVFICSLVPWWRGEGWVGFVSMSAFLSTLVWFLLSFLGLYQRGPAITNMVILDFITIICACVNDWFGAQSFAEFVCITAFITTLFFLVLHVLGLISRFPGPSLLIEFIYYCIFSVFYLIAAIVAATFAKQHSSIAACTFFAFAATAVYAVDTFFQYRAWRSGQAEMSTPNVTATTVTTTTHVHETTKVQAHETY